jgi:hypothetical protein
VESPLTELGYIGRQYCTAFNMQPRSFLKQDNALPICGRCVHSSPSSSSTAHSETHVERGLGRSWLCPRRLPPHGVIQADSGLSRCLVVRTSFLLTRRRGHVRVGSIKARGGVYEVLKWAETLATDGGLLAADDCRSKLLTDPAIRALLSSREVVVGSTGNLGLSVGLAAATLGMRCTVHMSDDAKAWKKSLLRQRGATVVEHSGNYSEAVTAGRAAAMADPDAHFVDDETSVDLFLGCEPHTRSMDGCCRLTLRCRRTYTCHRFTARTCGDDG